MSPLLGFLLGSLMMVGVAWIFRRTRPNKVDKWFRRNCKDVLARECSAAEKADVLAWLISLKR